MFIGRRGDLEAVLRQAQDQLRSSLAVELSWAESWGARIVTLVWFALAAVVLDQLRRLNVAEMLHSTVLPCIALVVVGVRLRQIRVQNVLNRLPALQLGWRPNARLRQISLDLAELLARAQLLALDVRARADESLSALSRSVCADVRARFMGLIAMLRACCPLAAPASLVPVWAQAQLARRADRQPAPLRAPRVLLC